VEKLETHVVLPVLFDDVTVRDERVQVLMDGAVCQFELVRDLMESTPAG
jgi:hypothetical protein